MFSSGSFSSISLAIVTPSFVIVGDPNFLSMTTFRPLGPSVTFTASASLSTPRRRLSRAFASNSIILAMGMFLLCGAEPHRLRREAARRLEDREDVGFAKDQIILLADLHFRARVLPVEDDVPLLHFGDDALSLFRPASGTDGDDLALGGAFLGRVGDDDSVLRDFFRLERFDDHPVTQRLDIQEDPPSTS